MYSKEEGPSSSEYIPGFDIGLLPCLEMVGSAWIHTITHKKPFVCPFFYNPATKTHYIHTCSDLEKDSPKCMRSGGGKLAPPSNTFLRSIPLDFRHAWKWLDLVRFTQKLMKILLYVLFYNDRNTLYT